MIDTTSDTAKLATRLTAKQVGTYRDVLGDATAMRAARVALSAIQRFAADLTAADLLRGAVIHGGDVGAWLTSLKEEATQNAAAARQHRRAFEEARLTVNEALFARDAAAMELIGHRQAVADLSESRLQSIRLEAHDQRQKLAVAGLTVDEINAFITQRHAGGFEEVEAAERRVRDQALGAVAALHAYLADEGRDLNTLPVALRAELEELAAALPARGQVTGHFPVNALQRANHQ